MDIFKMVLGLKTTM